MNAHMSWDNFENSFKILHDVITLEGFKPDTIVAVSRGGNVLATKMSYVLNAPLHSYDSKNKIWSQGILSMILLNKKILILDDINDSGKTIFQIREDIFKLSHPEYRGQLPIVFSQNNIKYGVLINNITSKVNVDYCGGFIDRDVDKNYIIFPWEDIYNK